MALTFPQSYATCDSKKSLMQRPPRQPDHWRHKALADHAFMPNQRMHGPWPGA